eukprot:c21275_g1_i1 orf=56-661(+)
MKQSQSSPDEPPICSDQFHVSPSKSPHQHRHAAPQPSMVQQETISSSPRHYPVSMRTYNQKDYNYMASFCQLSQAGMRENKSKAELSQHQNIHNEHTDNDITETYLQLPKQTQVSFPKFGAWNAEASSPGSEGYTDVFDCVREQKRGVSSPVESLPLHLQAPVKELAAAKIRPHAAGTHHRKWSTPRLESLLCCRHNQVSK